MSGGYFEYRNDNLFWIAEKILEWKNNIDEIDEYEHKDELKYYGMKVFSDTRKLYNTLNALDYFLSNDTCEETFIDRCKEVYGDIPKDGES